MNPLDQLSEDRAQWLAAAPTAHLATADASGAPHVIPICYAFDGQALFSVLDQKPKRAQITRLRRVRNIQENPRVSVVVDHYEEDWSRLGYILVMGTAKLLFEGREHDTAVGLLRQKYSQYLAMDLDANPVIKITPQRVVCWGTAPTTP